MRDNWKVGRHNVMSVGAFVPNSDSIVIQHVFYVYVYIELVWKVARYATAAPVYFSECDNYVDGGVKANDPSAFGLTEIQRFLSRYDKYYYLSFSLTPSTSYFEYCNYIVLSL